VLVSVLLADYPYKFVHMIIRCLITLLSFFFYFNLSAQHEILLYNASFEARSSQSTLPPGWYNCGDKGETFPDIHHTDFPGAHFGIDHPSIDGMTYLGMVARDNDTKEGIGQRLEKPLKAGQCYAFSFYAAKSKKLISRSRISNQTVNYDDPLQLIIWGGFSNCSQEAMLGVSAVVSHTDWKQHSITIQPKKNYTHFLLQASHTLNSFAYNGNLLLDHCSALIPTSCPESDEAVNWSLETVPIPRLEDEVGLRNYLKEEGKKIQFKYNEYLLELHCFQDESGKIHQLNKPLWKIAQALKQFPNYSINWSLVQTENLQSHQRYIELMYQLQKAGLSTDQYKISYQSKRKLKKGNWLWPLVKNSYCAQLEKRK
jgi:hypothetical protein